VTPWLSALTDNTVLQAVIIVLGSTALAVAGLLAVVHWVPARRRASDEGAKSAFLSLAGVAYTILLAFVVVAVWTDFSDAGRTSQDEVTRLSNLMRDSNAFPAAVRLPMRRSILTYAASVINREWRTMAHGDSDRITNDRYKRIWIVWQRYSPHGATASAFYDISADRLNDVGNARRERLIASQSSVPTLLWLLLLLGFVVTIAFTYQFKMAHLAMHVLSIAAIAALTGFVLFLIYSLQHPFAGNVAISPGPWRAFVHTWAGDNIFLPQGG
jgi:hypothetical protein